MTPDKCHLLFANRSHTVGICLTVDSIVHLQECAEACATIYRMDKINKTLTFKPNDGKSGLSMEKLLEAIEIYMCLYSCIDNMHYVTDAYVDLRIVPTPLVIKVLIGKERFAMVVVAPRDLR